MLWCLAFYSATLLNYVELCSRRIEALNCSTSVERNEMHNHIGKENVEPQIDLCNENFSESLLPLRSKPTAKQTMFNKVKAV